MTCRRAESIIEVVERPLDSKLLPSATAFLGGTFLVSVVSANWTVLAEAVDLARLVCLAGCLDLLFFREDLPASSLSLEELLSSVVCVVSSSLVSSDVEFLVSLAELSCVILDRVLAPAVLGLLSIVSVLAYGVLGLLLTAWKLAGDALRLLLAE